ncbi:MAG: tetratricopeptide repeat protein [Rhodospirillaceae bacterium]
MPNKVRTTACILTVCGLALGGVAPTAAMAQETVTTCDRLASHPEDPDRIIAGVATADVDQPAAIAACEADLKADPGNPRLTYQLARVYFYNGRSADAVATMDKAARAGHRQAQFVMGALITNNRPDASDDICDAEMWWSKSAKAGRLAAQVSYVRHVTKGLFDGCALNASKEEMSFFLDNVRATGGGDYYLRLLLADLTEDLAAYTGG